MEALRVSDAPAAAGTLYVVSTPIGNLGDLSPRAVETLRSVDLIVAEDTRHSRTLLTHWEVRTPSESYHEHNEARATPKLLKYLEGGQSIALISDAGTPLVSDPGARLVNAAIDAGIRVVPIPGASAVLAALVASGLLADRFTFYGFLDRKGTDRKAAVAEIAALRHTAILYEAPNRVGALLAELAQAGASERASVVARELTKQFEELVRGTVGELADRFADDPPRGEVVVLVAGGVEVTVDEVTLKKRAAELRAAGTSAREVARVLSLELGAPRNLAYRIAHE
jgi:16S rRNA (cytidine1402-2'-O)-methyltransferase